ncbi:MAG: YigZ family protein [Clostridia bacterium]|nr:YigZ family protein [Clostridia bacterium]
MADTYTTLRQTVEIEYVERKSVFLGYAAPVKTEEQALALIKERRTAMPDATHHVFGYHMKGGILARYSDDGEPQGTAGMPVLETIRKSGADDALVVVTRYFGGILLGAGGLVRAYANAAHLALEAAGIVTYEPYAELALACSYSDYQRYLSQLPRFGAIVDDTEFTDRVTIRFAVKKALVEDVQALVREISAGSDEVRVCGERFDVPPSAGA